MFKLSVTNAIKSINKSNRPLLRTKSYKPSMFFSRYLLLFFSLSHSLSREADILSSFLINNINPRCYPSHC